VRVYNARFGGGTRLAYVARDDRQLTGNHQLQHGSAFHELIPLVQLLRVNIELCRSG
jgi:hypothetical protein